MRNRKRLAIDNGMQRCTLGRTGGNVADKQQQIQTALRLDESMLELADNIAKRMSRPGLRLTRADLLRLAVHQGLAQLDAENKKR